MQSLAAAYMIHNYKPVEGNLVFCPDKPTHKGGFMYLCQCVMAVQTFGERTVLHFTVGFYLLVVARNSLSVTTHMLYY